MKKVTKSNIFAEHDERVDPGRRVDPERQQPAAEEQRHRDPGDDEHVQVLGEQERDHARAAVLGEVAGDELGVGLDEVERRRGWSRRSSAIVKTRKPTNCGMKYHMPPWAWTIVGQRQAAGGDDHADQREPLRDLVGDQLRRGAHRAEERVLRARRPAAEHQPVEGDRAEREHVQRADRGVDAVEADARAEDVRRVAERDERERRDRA